MLDEPELCRSTPDATTEIWVGSPRAGASRATPSWAARRSRGGEDMLLVLATSFLFELVFGLAMLLRPRQMRPWLMPDYRRYEGRFNAGSLLSFRFVGLGFLLMAAITGYGYLQLRH